VKPLGLVLLLGLAAAATAAPADPARLHAALAQLGTDAPRGWAYTVTIQRADGTSRERFDPARPPGAQWTLLERDGRPATAEERERHLRYRATSAPGLAVPTFQRGDLDLSSLERLAPGPAEETWRARFRPDAGSPVLAHCVVDLVVPTDGPPRIARTVLRSATPFSPALGVRLDSLEFGVDYLAPGDGRPALPAATRSRVRGRVFFLLRIDEDVAATFADYAPAGGR
jgi:hypothetical protein